MKQRKRVKTGGRKKGTPNKATNTMRTWLNGLIESNRHQIEDDIKALEPKDRLMILERFMQYTTPKMQSVKTDINLNNLTDEQLDTIISKITQDV